VGVAKILVKVV